MKPLLIGEQPSKHGDPLKPVEGRIGQRLAACCGLTFDEYLQAFDRVNLLAVRTEYYADEKYAGRGDAFDVRQASVNARALQQRLEPGRIAILLGKRAASAFGFVKVEYFEWFALNHAKAVVVPHPSGISRWWNDPDNVTRMHEFMHKLIQEMKT